MSGDKSTVVADGADSVRVTVTVRDAQGNPIGGALVVLEATGTGNTVHSPTALTDGSGVAVGSVRSTVAESKTIRAKVGGTYLTGNLSVNFIAGAFSPSVSGMSGDKSTVVADGADSVRVTVTVRDANGNPIAGASVVLEATGSGNTYRQPAGVTGSNGQAVGAVRSTVAELKTVRARVGATYLTGNLSVNFTAGAFSPSVSGMSGDKGTVVADGADSVRVTVTIRDANGNPISGALVVLEATGTGNTVHSPAALTDGSGVAVGSVRSTVAELKTIRARVGGTYLTSSLGVTFVAGSLHHFIVTHAGTAVAGAPSSVVIDARDASNNRVTSFGGLVRAYTSSAVPGDYISWGLGNAAGSIVSESGDTVRYQFVPADQGDAELMITDRKVESITIYAASGAVTSQSSSALSVTHAAADSVFIVSGDNQRAVVNHAVAAPLVVGVEDEFGNRVPGAAVTFAAVTGGGSVDTDTLTPGLQTTAATGSQGTASCQRWVLGTTAGWNSNSASASMSGGSTPSVTFRATTDVGAVASIVLDPPSKSVTVGSKTVVTATMRDAYGNLVVNEYVWMYIKDAADGSLSRAAGSSTDSLSAIMRRGRSDSTGTVSVTYDAPALAGRADVLDANSTTIGAESVADVVYTSAASGATDLRATVLAGATSQAGVSFSVRIEAVDGNGNRDTGNASHIVLAPPAPGGFTFSLTDFGAPITEANLSAGTIVLYGRGSKAGVWQIDLSASAPVLSPTHFDITIVPNATVSTYAVTAPASVAAGADFTVTAEARDAFGNRVTSANYGINLRAVRASDTTQAATGLLSIQTGSIAAGYFSASGFRYQVAEQIRVEVSGGVPVTRCSAPVSVGSAGAYQIVKVSGDSTGVAVGDSVLLRAAVYDLYGNAVQSQPVSFSVQTGSGHVPAGPLLTNAAGRVTAWFRTGTATGTNAARAAILDGNPEGLETAAFTVTTVPRDSIARVALAVDGSVFAAGQSFGGDVSAFDRYDNLITTDSHSQLRCVARGATMSFVPPVMTLSAGEAAFSASDTKAGTTAIRVLSLAGDSLSPWSPSITILPASAYQVFKVSGDSTGVTAGGTAPLVTRVRDQYGNPVPSETVRFAITSNLGGTPSLWDNVGSPNDGIVVTDAAGLASCVLTTDVNAGLNTVSASILDANPPARERVLFSVTTGAGSIARYDVIPDGFSKKAGQSFGLDLTGYDANGNVAVGDNTTVVALGSNGAAVFSSNPVTLSSGRAHVTVYDNTAQRLVLRAETSGGGALSYSDTIVVSPEVPGSPITFATVAPSTITANGSSLCAITTNPVRDVYGNVVAPGTLVRVSPSIGAVQSEDQDPSTPATVERRTEATGAVSVFIRSALTPGVCSVLFQSLTGTASGTAAVTFAAPPACSYAGYLSPRHLVPTNPAQFRCSIANASATAVTLGTQTAISFSDSVGDVYDAHLPASVVLAGSRTDTLVFASVAVPGGMIGGTYTPRVALRGTDAYGSSYQADFDAGANSVSVSDVDLLQVTSSRSIVSRGDTFTVEVRVRNGGGSSVSVSDLQLIYANGSYGTAGEWSPALPNALPASTERIYTRAIRVLSASPLGPDTIDASVLAYANGSPVVDLTAWPNVATLTIQSAASISYVAGTLSPTVVSKGQSHTFSLSFMNSGQAAVILDGSSTRLTLGDGAGHSVVVSLGSAGALPGGKATTVTFPAGTIPAAMNTGSYPVSVRLVGTENGASFDEAIATTDLVQVVSPAQLAYRPGSIAPTVVSKGSSVSFAVGINNTGGAQVVCNADSTWLTFSSGSIVYLAKLDAARGRTLLPGSNTIYFTSVLVPATMPVGPYAPAIRIGGAENGLPFVANLVSSNQISVQEPSQLAITSTTVSPSDRVTADQTPAWSAAIHLQNNGGATVRLESLAVKLFLGSSEVTGQYVITPIGFTPSVDSIRGGEAKTLTVEIRDNVSNAMATGTVVIESIVVGRDMNSQTQLVATTESGGKGSFLVQSPASPAITAIRSSADTVTALQTKDWTVDVALRNAGESDIALDLAVGSSLLTFSTSGDFSVPLAGVLLGGGSVLEGGSVDTLQFTVDRAGSAAGLCTIDATVRGTETNSGRSLVTQSGSSGVHGALRVQSPAQLQIVKLTGLQNPVTVEQARAWTIDMEVANTGGSDLTLALGRLDSTYVRVSEGTGFTIDNPTSLAGDGLTLRGDATGILRFTVSHTGTVAAGARPLAGALLAIEKNSDRHVFASRGPSAPTETVTFELLPEPQYAPGSITPTVVSSGTSVSFELEIASLAGTRSTFVLDRDATTLSFGDADGDTFRTSLAPVSDTVLSAGGTRRLIFSAAPVDSAIARGTYSASIRLAGTENGNPYSRILSAASDPLTVENAPQLSISRIVTPQSVTRSQSKPWPVLMVLRNNGEASVRIDFSHAATNVSFYLIGIGDRTGEYTVVDPTRLEGSGTAVLPGGGVDSLVFTVTGTGSTPGVALVNGRVTATDVNSGDVISDDTYSGGFSHVAVELPGDPAVASTAPSRAAVTSGQTTPWDVTLEVCNEGEAALTLVLDSTAVFRDNRQSLLQTTPSAFVEGGLTLPGGSCRHLVFTILATPSLPSGADMALHAHVGFTENNSDLYRSYDTRLAGSGAGTIRVQAPAALRIASVASGAPRAPYVDRGQRFPVRFTIDNVGEAGAADVSVALADTGASSIEDTIITLSSLDGGGEAVDSFMVVAAQTSGLETFRARVKSARDANSLEDALFTILAPADDTTRAMIQSPAALSVAAVVPSQAEVNARQSVDWTVRVDLANTGEAPLAVARPQGGDISFALGGTRLFDYFVVAPETLMSGASDLSLAGGASDALIYRVVSTGSDTGSVDVAASIVWNDSNVPGASQPPAAGSGSVRVKPPSGLRIISVTSGAPNNGAFPNTSIVDTDQGFSVAVRVENTGGDDLDSVQVRLASSGGSRAAIEGDSLVSLPAMSERDFVFDVTAASAAGVEILQASIVHAVSRNTGERVVPAEAVESIENLRIEVPARLACAASVTAPRGAVDDTLSAGQVFVVTGVVTNEGQSAVDAGGRLTLTLPASIRLENATDPLTKPFAPGVQVSWSLVAPSTATLDSARVSISAVPKNVNRGASCSVRVSESVIVVSTESAARLSGCALAISAPAGAADGTLSTDQEFTARATFTPSRNADSVQVELAVPSGFSVIGDRVRFVGRGDGAEKTLTWTVKAPAVEIDHDTLVARATGVDVNANNPIPPCRVTLPVHVAAKPLLRVTARISAPSEALDGVVSVNLPFTVEAIAVNGGGGSVDTTLARIELVVPAGQGYRLEGVGETFRKPFAPGTPVTWNLRAPEAPTVPGNISVSFVEPYAKDANTNAPCDIGTREAFVPVQTEAGAVLMANISPGDTTIPVVVPRGAANVPVLRVTQLNTSGYTVGLDTLYVSIRDGAGNRLADASQALSSVMLRSRGETVTHPVAEANPIPVVVAHEFEIAPGAVDTLLVAVDIAAGASAGELRVEIERSSSVVMTVSTGGGTGPRVGVALEVDGGDIAGHFVSGPLTIMSARFDEYAHNYPNPFRAGSESTKICYVLTQDAPVTIRVYDLLGSLVWSAEMAAGGRGGTGAPAGTPWEIPWDGRNERGELVRNGVYLCKIEAGSQSALFKIAVAK